jgi:hypothetical protein
VSDPERLIHSKGLASDLLSSAKNDRAPDGARRAFVAAAAGIAATAHATTATASTVSTIARLATWKWFAMGVLGVGSMVATKTVLVPAVANLVSPPAAHSSSPAGRARAGGAATASTLASEAVVAPPPVAPPVPPPPDPEPAVAPATNPAEASRAIAPAPPTLASAPSKPKVAAPSAATAPTSEPAPVAAHPTSASRLSAEIVAVDQMKSALAQSDTTEALRLNDAYRAAFPAGRLSAEASALRIEALARAGRRDEARSELQRFRAEHPDSPILDNLAQVVGR